jgi:hypothetical protein
VLTFPLLCTLFLSSKVYSTPGNSVYSTTRCEWWAIPGDAESLLLATLTRTLAFLCRSIMSSALVMICTHTARGVHDCHLELHSVRMHSGSVLQGGAHATASHLAAAYRLRQGDVTTACEEGLLTTCFSGAYSTLESAVCECVLGSGSMVRNPSHHSHSSLVHLTLMLRLQSDCEGAFVDFYASVRHCATSNTACYLLERGARVPAGSHLTPRTLPRARERSTQTKPLHTCLRGCAIRSWR